MQLSKTQNSEFRINPENLHPCTWQQEVVRKIGVQREKIFLRGVQTSTAQMLFAFWKVHVSYLNLLQAKIQFCS